MEKEGLELAENVAKEAAREMKEDRSFAMELILNARNDAKRWFVVAMTILFMWLATIAGFLIYLNQYDYTSTIDAVGVYTAVDQSGNIITQDVTPEQWGLFMEWLNGKDKSNESKN